MKDLKNKATNLAGLLIAAAAFVLLLPEQGVVLPHWAEVSAKVAGALGGAIIAYLTGKDTNGKKIVE